ncbi:phosphatidylinositol 3-related kinase [Trypanosoma cruzi]|nr:phosphatidylinositol 3-related kinase [Trypanosoma cruzi]
MKADDGGYTHSTTSHQSPQKTSHRTADVPSDLPNRPTQSLRSAKELIRQRRSTVVPRITDIFALCQPHEEGERVGLRNAGAVKVGAENVTSGAIHKFMPHARAADQRGELRGHFDGNMRCGAIDPTAARQDAGGPFCKCIEPRWKWRFWCYQKLRRVRKRSRRAPLTTEKMNQFVRSRTD